MGERPTGVNPGDRVRLTVVHTGIVREIDADGFVLESQPGRPVHGSFHGDAEFTWVRLPSLPPEPPDGSVVRIGERGPIFDRDDSAVPGNECWGDRRWLGFGPDAKPLRITWAEVCTGGTPVRLAPDPFGEPVELPWEPAAPWSLPYVRVAAEPGGVGLTIGQTVDTSDGYALDAAEARSLARALWSAANQADALPTGGVA